MKHLRIPVRYFIVIVCLLCAIFFPATITARQPNMDSLFTAAKNSIEKNNYSAAIIQFNNYLSEAKKLKDTLLIGNAHIGIGIAYDRAGDYEDGLLNYFTALKFYESIGNKKKIAGTWKNIGNIYRILKSYDKSRQFLDQALWQYEEISDSTGSSGVLNDMGIMYMDQKKYPQAIDVFEKVITHYEKYIKEEVKAFALNNLASSLSSMHKFEDAYGHYQSSLALMKKMNHQYGLALVYLNLSDFFLLGGNTKKAIEYGGNSIAISQNLHSKGLLAAAYKNMGDAYLKLKDYRQAANFLSRQINFKDTVFKEESARSYAEMETKYQNEKKQKEILKLEQQNIVTNSKIEKQRLERNFLISGLAFIVLISVILLWNFYIKQKANKQLNVLNTKLNEANYSKTKLLGILSHDLRSPISSLFSFLQFQKQAPGRLTLVEQDEHNEKISAAADNLLDTMEDLLIWSKSQMENFNPIFEYVNLSDFFEDVIKVNETAARNKNIGLLKDCPHNINLYTDTNFLKVIFRNLTSNAIKFTPDNGVIELSAIRKADDILLTVKDNGAGIASTDLATIFEWNSIRSDSSGLGLKLAKEFTEKLNGSIKVDSAINKGTSFTLSLPINPQSPQQDFPENVERPHVAV
ncbi:MAG: tetratricopeptide repeat protein [Chitinophagaceae bacterium]